MFLRRLIVMLGLITIIDQVQAGSVLSRSPAKKSEIHKIVSRGNMLVFSSEESGVVGRVTVSAVDVMLTCSQQRRRLMFPREREPLVLAMRWHPEIWAWEPHVAVAGKFDRFSITCDGPQPSPYWHITTIMPEGQGRFKAKPNRFYRVCVYRLGNEFKGVLACKTFLFTGRVWIRAESLELTPGVWYSRWPSGGD